MNPQASTSCSSVEALNHLTTQLTSSPRNLQREHPGWPSYLMSKTSTFHMGNPQTRIEVATERTPHGKLVSCRHLGLSCCWCLPAVSNWGAMSEYDKASYGTRSMVAFMSKPKPLTVPDNGHAGRGGVGSTEQAPVSRIAFFHPLVRLVRFDTYLPAIESRKQLKNVHMTSCCCLMLNTSRLLSRRSCSHWDSFSLGQIP